MNPSLTALTRWVEMLANESAQLDPVARARLRSLAGRSIAVEFDPPGESATLSFDLDSIRLTPGFGEAPSVIVRGSPGAIFAAFLDANGGRRGITIDGDDVMLSEFRSIVRDFHPDVPSPLDDIVGREASQALASAFELGFAALAALGRSLGEEGSRLVRGGARQKYLTVPEFASFVESTRALQVRIDRLAVRTGLVERSGPRS